MQGFPVISDTHVHSSGLSITFSFLASAEVILRALEFDSFIHMHVLSTHYTGSRIQLWEHRWDSGLASRSFSGQSYESAWLGHSAQMFGQTSIKLLLWRYLLDGLTLQISRLWTKSMTLCNVGGLHPISWRQRKDWGSCQKRKFCLQMRLHSSYSTDSFLGLQPACLPASFGLVSLHNHMSQFIKITLHLQRDRQVGR